MWSRIDPLAIFGIVLFAAIWMVSAEAMQSFMLPGPVAVFHGAYENFTSAKSLAFYGLERPSLAGNLAYTLENVVVAVAIGSMIGTVLGLVTARSPVIKAIIDPVARTFGMVPVIILSPFLLLFFGVSRASSIFTVAFYSAVILYIYAQRAADNLDPVFEQNGRTLGVSRSKLVRDILIPGTMPEVLGGMRIALAGAWGLEAITELMGSQAGIGKVILSLAISTDVQGIFTALLVLAVIGYLADIFAAQIFGRLTTWNDKRKS